MKKAQSGILNDSKTKEAQRASTSHPGETGAPVSLHVSKKLTSR